MLIAEIRRKLLSIDDIDFNAPDATCQVRDLMRETKEDLLTADVFGVLKYLPRHPYLESVMSALVQLNQKSEKFSRHVEKIKENISRLEFKFWPKYTTPVELGVDRTEPDVEISDDDTLILLEAKLGSKFGDRQLERELAVAYRESRKREFFVVLVTRGSTPPRFKYGNMRLRAIEYLQRIGSSGEFASLGNALSENAERVLWISWSNIQRALEEALKKRRELAGEKAEEVLRAAEMISDLRELLKMRQIQPFIGFVECFKRGLLKKTEVRPVFLMLTSEKYSRIQIKYNLLSAFKYAPQEFGWCCLPYHITEAVKFLGIGNSCRGREISDWKHVILKRPPKRRLSLAIRHRIKQ